MPDHPERAHAAAPDTHEDNHGSTPAAWATVTIIMAAFLIGSVAMIAEVWWLFWVAVAMLPAAAIVGKILASMGLGAHSDAGLDALESAAAEPGPGADPARSST